MTTFSQYTGIVTNSDGRQVSIREGEIWPDDDITVKEHPEQFTTTEPNSEVAGAFPMEHKLRDSNNELGDTVEQKRWEGHHPPGYETGKPEDLSPDSPAVRDGDETPDTGDKKTPEEPSGPATGRVERATRAPGETRNVRTPAKGKDKS